MILKLKYFGLIAEALNKSDEEIQITAPLLVADLRKIKETECPALATSDYRVAVNQTLVDETFEINSASEIAFLPPFSGG